MNPLTGRPLDVGLSGLETPGNAKKSDAFFEKGVLKASESVHVASGNAHEVKVITNGHCHGMFRKVSHLNFTTLTCSAVTENCRRVSGVWLCFGGGG